MTESAPQEIDSICSESASRRSGWISLLVLAFVLCSGWLAIQSREQSFPDGVTEAQTEQARRLFVNRFGIDPDHADILAMLGEQLRDGGELDLAAECYAAIPDSHPRFGPHAQLQLGIILAENHRAAAAEAELRSWLQKTAISRHSSIEDQVSARQWLSYLLSVQLRLEERQDILAQSQADGLASLNDSKQFYFPHLLLYRTARGAARLRQYLDRDPQNLQLRVAHARYLTGEGQLAAAEQLLRRLDEQSPNNRAVTAALLECLYEQDNWKQFSEVVSTAPSYQDGEPWLLTEMRGRFALHEGRWDDARHAFQSVLATEPAHSACQMGLVTALRNLDDETTLAAAEQRTLVLARIRVELPRTRSGKANELLVLADLCTEAGLSEAAERFRRHAQQSDQNSPGMQPALEAE